MKGIDSMEMLNERFNEAKMFKDRWLALYQDVYRFVIPDRDAFNVKWNYQDDGKPTTLLMWDTTAMLAAYQRANDLHALLMPKDRVWGKLLLDSHKFNKADIQRMQPIIDEVNDNVMFYLNESNIARAVSDSNLDLACGTAAIWVESIDDDTPLCFRSIPGVALYIEYSNDDVIATCWFQCKMSARQVCTEFKDWKSKRRAAFMASPNDKHTIVYGQIKLSESEYYIYATLQDEPDQVLFERVKHYNQIIIYRDRVRPGECDGRGIAIDMLPTIRDLNRMVMDDRKNMAFKANPPMFWDDNSYFNPYSVRQWAGAWIARRSGERNPVEALQMPVYPEVSEKVLALQTIIKDAFQVDPLGEVDQAVRSATEVSIRENRAQRTSATDISRVINELPKQVYIVAAKILAERQLLTKDRKISEIKTNKLKFDFQSPLYDLQKQDDLNHLAGNLQMKQQFFGEGATMATVNIPELNDWLTEKFNLPAKLFKDSVQLAQIMKVMGQQAQQQPGAGQPTPTTAASNVQLPQATPIQ